MRSGDAGLMWILTHSKVVLVGTIPVAGSTTGRYSAVGVGLLLMVVAFRC